MIKNCKNNSFLGLKFRWRKKLLGVADYSLANAQLETQNLPNF